MKWIIPFNCNKHNYDLEGALYDCGVDWNRNNYTYENGDTVYIYECEPENRIRYKCVVTADYKTIATFDDEKYGGVWKGYHFEKPQIETQLEYEFRVPVKVEELAEHGMRTKRIAVMKADGRRTELFRFIEEYEENDRTLKDDYNPNTEKDPNTQVIPGGERETIVSQRIHQREFRRVLLRKYSHCCLCPVSNPELLTASHIKPWAYSTAEEKTDPDNGLLLCPNHDSLFDKGFISFDKTGKILIANELSEINRTFMNVNPNTTIDMNDNMNTFMEYHRNHVFKQ